MITGCCDNIVNNLQVISLPLYICARKLVTPDFPFDRASTLQTLYCSKQFYISIRMALLSQQFIRYCIKTASTEGVKIKLEYKKLTTKL